MGLAVIGAAVACLIGWNVSKVHMAHRGIPARRRQLREYRRDRTRHGIWLVGMAALLLLLLFIVASVH